MFIKYKTTTSIAFMFMVYIILIYEHYLISISYLKNYISNKFELTFINIILNLCRYFVVRY